MKKLVDEHLINEMEELHKFIKEHNRIFIWGNGVIGKALHRFLGNMEIEVEGILVSQKTEQKDLFEIQEIDVENVGIIMGCDDKYYSEIIPLLVKHKVLLENVFFLSQSNKNNVEKRMRRLEKDEFHYSVHLAEYCNLNCQMCNQFSPVSERKCMSYETYEKDCKRLSELFGGMMKWINLTGGEALLNPDVIRFIELTRQEFPSAQIKLCSNGILLLKNSEKLWEACKKNAIEIWVTPYPINVNYKQIEEIAGNYGVPFFYAVDFFSQEIANKTSCIFPMSTKGDQNRMNCIFCNGYQDWITLYEGRLYNCSTIYPSRALNSRFGTKFTCDWKRDSIDIYQVDSWEEIVEFERTIPEFCKYCCVGERKDGFMWKRSEGRRNEWIL